MKRNLIILALLGLIVAACASGGSTTLAGTWKLTAYGPKESPSPAVPDAEATLSVGNDGTVGGNGGCNSLGGTYEVDGNQITFSDITSTLMACDDARMAQESTVTKVLSGTAEYAIDGNTLTLTSDDTVLVFTSANP
jgi:heat shock protein HslJ